MEQVKVKCNQCDGTGKSSLILEYKIKGKEIMEVEYPYEFTCIKCHGSGELDWIDEYFR